MPESTLYVGDCLAVLPTLPANSVDAIVTDPPYGLGFMGKAWDDLPPGEDWARECLRVLKPGGHLLAFGGTRTWHRLAVAVEDAGFEMRDSIAWLYGSGFPKSLNVGKAVETAQPPSLELMPEEVKFCEWMRDHSGLSHEDCRRLFTSARFLTGEVEIVNTATRENPRWGRRSMVPTAAAWAAALPELPEVPAWVSDLVKSPPKAPMQTPSEWTAGRGQGTEASGQWAGWGTALKPAFEPIVVARKPFKGTVAANVLEWGTGAVNVDGCRIGNSKDVPASPSYTYGKNGIYGDSVQADASVSGMNPNVGRWPANVVLDEDAAAELDGQGTPLETNGASRFFYCAKAPKRERPVVDGVAHPTVKPLTLMRWLVRLVTPPGGTVLDTFAGSGATVEAALLEGFDVVAIEREAEYVPLIEQRVGRVA